MGRGLVLAIVLAGCYQRASETACTVVCGGGGECPGVLECDRSTSRCAPHGQTCMQGRGTDAGADALDAPPLGDQICVGDFTELYVCIPQQPLLPVSYTTPAQIDTSTGCTAKVVLVNGVTACVIAGTTITVSAPLTVIGPNPLVLMSVGDFALNATIDASSHLGGNPGPGTTQAIDCTTPGTTTAYYGGAGGSFGNSGGFGGRGDGQAMPPPVPGAQALAGSLQAGCFGGDGANDGNNQGQGFGGLGGGAIALLARGSFTATGAFVNAGGAGGFGGQFHSGGGAGGGGSGGMIVIDATSYQLTDVSVYAEGGGGGGGGGGATGDAGAPGSDAFGPQALGGPGGAGMGIGDGGDGSYGDVGGNGSDGLPPGGALVGGGGGGGGGSTGIIWWYQYPVGMDVRTSPGPTRT